MARIRAQVNMPRKSGLPADVITNTWHFSTSALPLDQAAADAIATGLQGIYAAADNFFSPILAVPGATIKFYDLDDPMPRPPRFTKPLSLSIAAGSGLPEEVAICLSFSGPAVAGVPAARRRGRVFLGPWATSASLTDDVAGRVFINPTVRDALKNAALALNDAHGPEDPYKWSVFSPTDNAMVPVTKGWVDEAYDTVRSRGTASKSRATWALP